ncbi:MAG TPA: hypothetical protein VIY53_01050 [Acidobacteriaceae bacterium]
MTLERHTGTDARHAGEIDAALRALGTATPEPGLEGRVLTRLAAARMQGEPMIAGPAWWRRLPRPVMPLLGFTCAGILCAGIVAGSVSHSRHNQSGPVPPPVMQMPGTGVGAASAMHPAAPASTPVPAGTASRGHSSRRNSKGRARITPEAHKAPGVAVPAPDSNLPPQ